MTITIPPLGKMLYSRQEDTPYGLRSRPERADNMADHFPVDIVDRNSCQTDSHPGHGCKGCAHLAGILSYRESDRQAVGLNTSLKPVGSFDLLGSADDAVMYSLEP